jgi:hypothetical protein
MENEENRVCGCFKRPEDGIKEMVEEFSGKAEDGPLDFLHIFDFVFLFLYKQAEFFNLHRVLRIKSDFFFREVLKPAYENWSEKNPNFVDSDSWNNLPNGEFPVIFYGQQTPAFLERETLLSFFFPEKNDDCCVRGNWPRYLERTIRAITIPLFASEKNKPKLESVLDLGMAIWRDLCSLDGGEKKLA